MSECTPDPDTCPMCHVSGSLVQNVIAKRDRYRDALVQLWTNSTLNEHQTEIVRDALGL